MTDKKNTKYDESSFVTITREPQGKTPATSTPIEEVAVKEFCKVKFPANKNLIPLSKGIDLLNEIPDRKSMERSFFSLNENINDIADNETRGFPRSKSFGNDIAEAIPFIDSTEENGNQEYTYDNAAFTMQNNEKTDDEHPNALNETLDNRALSGSNPSAPNTPERSDKYVQTDDSSESPEAKRTPKRRFPRLGTFERMKSVEKKSVPDANAPTPSSPTINTRTGTSFKHRRHIKTTVSKELLIKATAVSPTKDENPPATEEPPESPAADKKKSKGLFSRLFKRSSKSLDSDKSDVNSSGDVQMCNLDEALATMERPPDYESAVGSTDSSWVSS